MCCDRTWLQPPWDARIESLNIFERSAALFLFYLWRCDGVGKVRAAWVCWFWLDTGDVVLTNNPSLHGVALAFIVDLIFMTKHCFALLALCDETKNFPQDVFSKFLRFPWVRCVSMSSETILVEAFCRKISRKAVKRIFRPFFLRGDVAAINWNVMRFLVFWSVKFDLRDFCWFFHRYQLPVLFLL